MDLIHKEDVVLAEVGQQRGQIPRLFNGRAGGHPQVDAHLVGDDAGERRLAQAWGAVEQHMVQRLPPQLGRVDEDREVLLGLFLADVFRQLSGTQRQFSLVLPQVGGGQQGLLGLLLRKVDAHGPSPFLLRDHFSIFFRAWRTMSSRDRAARSKPFRARLISAGP